jgi:hypothetical protein
VCGVCMCVCASLLGVPVAGRARKRADYQINSMRRISSVKRVNRVGRFFLD